MARSTPSILPRSSNHANSPSAPVRTVNRLSRFAAPASVASVFESLESRQLMSASALLVPTSPTVSATSPTSITLGWSDSDTTNTGYIVLRSTNDSSFSQLKKITSRTIKAFVDTSVLSDTSYWYKIESYSSSRTSAASTPVSTTTPLNAPTGLSAALSGSQVTLSWKNNDPTASSYNVLRSTDGVHFSVLSTLTGGSTKSFVDKTITAGTVYHYEVQAVKGSNTSAVSTAAVVTDPLAAPSGLAAVVQSSSWIHLSWTDNAPAATGYLILRSTDGVHFTQLSTLYGEPSNSFDDKTVSPFTTYYYQVQATTAAVTSPVSNTVTGTTPLAIPTGIAATVTGTASVKITWTDSDPAAQGYIILRSTGGSFAQVGTTNSGQTTSFTDTTVSSDTDYSYAVKSFNGTTYSAVSNVAAVATPLLAPSGLTANTSAGISVTLSWTDNDTSATGYLVLRSTDGIHFSQLTTLNSATADSYVDTTATPGQKYYYQVQATGNGMSSSVSNTVSVTAAATSTAPTVSVTTRYGDELVITATGTDDTISVAQSGSSLSITTDGQTSTDPAPAGGLFVYTRGGTDAINIASSVSTRTTLETINTGVTDINSAAANVTAWISSSDIYTGTGTVHTVSSFAGGVSMAPGAALPNPGDAGTTMQVTGSLWGTGPVVSDVNQGDAGDCYFLSSLASFAKEQPATLEQTAVDMGDGTYVVKFMNGNTPTYVRVSNAISTYGGGSYVYARPGSDGDLWAVIMEKAFAYFRTGANAYASINSGWMGEVYSDLGVNSNGFLLSGTTATSFYSTVSTALAANKEVTLGTSSSAPNLVSNHAYTLISVTTNSAGQAEYMVRNPWGISGDSLENSQGYATLTYAQMVANFVDCCVAV